MVTANGATPAYLLAPQVNALLFYMTGQYHHMLFSTYWNTGVRSGESQTLTPESFDLDLLLPFVKVLSEKVQARRRRGAFFASCDGAHVPPKLHHAHALLKEVIHALAGHKDP